MSAPVVMLGQGDGNGLLLVEANARLDAGASYTMRATSNRVAPAGVGGECLFTTLYLGVTHTMAVDLIVTPIVDDVALDPITVTLDAQASRKLERFEVPLSVPLLDGLGVEQGRHAARGDWFQFTIKDDGLAAGDLILEVAELEYEVVRESLQAVG